MAVTITINGEPRRFDAAMSVRELLTGLGLDPAKIAVERNLEIVPRSQYAHVMAGEGDRFEIVHFIGGGNAPVEPPPAVDKPFTVAGRTFKSRLIIGTGNTRPMRRTRARSRPAGRRSSPSRYAV